jgi:hypothetical protein
MAQTNFTPIQLYFSSTTTNVPLAANLANGELAINITDGKLFYKDNANAVQVIAWKVTPTSAGGTGLTSYTAGDMVYYASGTAFSKLGIGTADYVMTSSGTAPQWSQFLKAVAGGTGQTSYAVGDLLYADTTTTLAKLPDVATGNALISGGVSTAPSWGKIGLTTHVSGILPVANGGTNASSASITAFNNITGYSASGATGTTTTNLVFSTSPSITTPTLVGDVTLSTGNLVVSNGKGIDFSATPGTGTSELLADYEEGTWTPATVSSVTNFTGTPTVSSGKYVKVGRLCTVQAIVSGTVTTANLLTFINISALPFNRSAATDPGAGIAASITTYSVGRLGNDAGDATTIFMIFPASSQLAAGANTFQISFTYVTA